MASVTLADIKVAFGERVVLESVNFLVTDSDKIALSGANGSGKSTLMKIMAKISPPDSGTVAIERGTRVSYLPQSGVALSNVSLWAEAEKSFDEVLPILAEIADIEAKMGRLTEGSTDAEKLVNRHHELHERVVRSDYYSREKNIHTVLNGLGFREEDFGKNVREFSAGWQMRIALAKVLLENPHILLLDEPTNYLDIEARNWLEGFLLDFKGGFLIVSHDRYFLDTTVSKIAEIYFRRLNIYKGNYTEYETRRAVELESIQEAYKKQQEEISKIEEFIKRFRFNSSKAKLVQSRIKLLERIELIEKPPGLKKIHFSFPKPPHSGNIVVTLNGITKSYKEKTVLKNVNLQVEKGEKLALVGVNGAGKTTLIKIIADVLKQDSGDSVLGKDVTIQKFLQDDVEQYTSAKSVMDEIEAICPFDLIPNLRNMLGSFLFSGDDVHKPVSVLSGGEKSRVALLKMLLHPANFLLLDEPTNHLDMFSKDILLDALQSYAGTCIFVSHDRYFIQNLATKVFEIENGVGRLFYGDYDYFMRKKASDLAQGCEPAVEAKKDRGDQEGKSSREDEKRKKAEMKKWEKEEEKILERLEELDHNKAGLEHQMTDESVYSDGQKMKEIRRTLDEMKDEHNRVFSRWEEVTEKLSELKNGL